MVIFSGILLILILLPISGTSLRSRESKALFTVIVGYVKISLGMVWRKRLQERAETLVASKLDHYTFTLLVEHYIILASRINVR